MKRLIRMLRREAGQALPMALILLFVGALIIVPVLSLNMTSLRATQQADERNRDIYAADAGIEDGLWKVKYNYLEDWLLHEWGENVYDHDPQSYIMYDNDIPADTVTVNDRNVDVDISPVWLLESLETPSSSQGNDVLGYGRTPDERLLTFGGIIGTQKYEIGMFHDAALDPLMIERIGCWLPPGFHYDETGECNLEGAYQYAFNRQPYAGGEIVTWDFSPYVNFNDLPAQGSKRIVTFYFTPDDDPREAFAWARTTNANVKLAWDTSRKIFEIEARAPSGSDNQTIIVAHNVKKEFQALGAALSGDYAATGKTLMRNHDDPENYINTYVGDHMRERLYEKTSAAVKSKAEDPNNGIPQDAVVEKIFLYWSGWKCKPLNPTDAQLPTLTADKHVNEVAFRVNVGGVQSPAWKVTAQNSQVKRNLDTSDRAHGWSYSCSADVTDLVTNYFSQQQVDFRGYGTYTLGHWYVSSTDNTTFRYKLYTWNDNHSLEPAGASPTPVPPLYTCYPLGSPRLGGYWTFSWPGGWTFIQQAYEDQRDQDQDYWPYCAWSVVVIYSSPTTAGHHLYLYDEFKYCPPDTTHNYLRFTVKGFLAPSDVGYDTNAARLTCFVGDGDFEWTGDNLYLNDVQMNGDSINPNNNVWNSRSNVFGTVTEGIDIDTFSAGGGTVILPGATEATLYMPTGTDVWDLIYTILSFRSEITTGGTIDYTIK